MARTKRLNRGPRTKRAIGGFAISPWAYIDAAAWLIMFVLALWTRFDFSTEELINSLSYWHSYVIPFALVLGTWGVGWLAGLYRGRFVPGSLLETSVLTAVFGGVTVLVFVANMAIASNHASPRSIPLIAGSYSTLAVLILRSLVRRKELFGAGVSESAEPAIIFGAGDGGVQLVRQLRRSKVANFRPLAILDDDVSKHHMLVDGVRVRGGREEIERLAERKGAATLIIAVPSIPREDLVDIRDRAEAAGLNVLILPALDSMMRGRIVANELREINVNDLLGRKPARLNQTQIAELMRGKRVMITGAGGSIGSELCRQISRFRPAELMMLDRDESGLHSVQLSISDQAMLDGEDTILVSIRDRSSLFQIFQDRKPDIVFHAAALKHMPLLDRYPYRFSHI